MPIPNGVENTQPIEKTKCELNKKQQIEVKKKELKDLAVRCQNVPPEQKVNCQRQSAAIRQQIKAIKSKKC